jgi:hypothetical protein
MTARSSLLLLLLSVATTACGDVGERGGLVSVSTGTCPSGKRWQ